MGYATFPTAAWVFAANAGIAESSSMQADPDSPKIMRTIYRDGLFRVGLQLSSDAATGLEPPWCQVFDMYHERDFASVGRNDECGLFGNDFLPVLTGIFANNASDSIGCIAELENLARSVNHGRVPI